VEKGGRGIENHGIRGSKRKTMSERAKEPRRERTTDQTDEGIGSMDRGEDEPRKKRKTRVLIPCRSAVPDE